MINFIFSLLILLCSLLGYSFFLFKKYDIKIEFVPVIIFSSITVLMYISGLLNFMPQMVQIILVFGILLWIYILKDIKSNIKLIKDMITPGTILFVILGCYFIVFLNNITLIHYDNFSHWGLIVRNMWLNDRLPNFLDSAITFRTYPPGTAVFIYFLQRL